MDVGMVVSLPGLGYTAQAGTDTAGHPLLQRNLGFHTMLCCISCQSLQHWHGTAGIDDIALYSLVFDGINHRSFSPGAAIFSGDENLTRRKILKLFFQE